jgi:hypothetical protein
MTPRPHGAVGTTELAPAAPDLSPGGRSDRLTRIGKARAAKPFVGIVVEGFQKISTATVSAPRPWQLTSPTSTSRFDRRKPMTVRSAPVGVQELEAVCEECRFPIADGEGSAWVDGVAARATVRAGWEAREARQAREALADEPTTPHQDGLPPAVPLGEAACQPAPARWRVQHYACAPQAREGVYDIAVANLRTWRDLVGWTAHLAGRPEAAGFTALIGAAAQPDANRLPAGLRPLRVF